MDSMESVDSMESMKSMDSIESMDSMESNDSASKKQFNYACGCALACAQHFQIGQPTVVIWIVPGSSSDSSLSQSTQDQ